MIIVTGGAGFIGSNLIADLNAAGRSDIILIDYLEDGVKWRNIAKRRFQDIVFPDEAEAFLARVGKVDAIFHLGANSATTARDGDAIVRTNLRPSMMYWNWCTEKRVPFVYASSAATYGDGHLGFRDEEELDFLDRLTPLSLYGWSKHAFDKWAIEQSAQTHRPPMWAGLKFFNVYGPHEDHKNDMRSLCAKMFRHIAAGDRISLFRSHREGFGDGDQLRDFIYVKDCTSVMLWLWQRGISGLFNLGTGHARSFKDLMLATGAAMEKDVEIDYVDMPFSIRDQYQYFTQADMSKLRQAGYDKPFYSIESGLRDWLGRFPNEQDLYR